MLSLLRCGSFCAECGNEIPSGSVTFWQRIRQHRYLCDFCSNRQGIGRRRLVGTLVLVVASFLMLKNWNREMGGTPVSAWDATAVRPERDVAGTGAGGAGAGVSASGLTESDADKPVRVMCGARTKKGTPCKRMVLPGMRCAQHQGREAMRLTGERR